MVTYHLILTVIIAALWGVGGEPRTHRIASPATRESNTTSPSVVGGGDGALPHNVTDAAVGSRISSLMTHLPTVKTIVICVCVLTAALITCLLVRVVRYALDGAVITQSHVQITVYMPCGRY